MTRSRDELAEGAAEILAASVNGDPMAAIDLFVKLCVTAADGFTVCCGLANLIATVGIAASDPTADGPLLVELEVAPGADPAYVRRNALAMSDVAGFIAGVGNDDYEAAWQIFEQVCCRTVDRRSGLFLHTLLKMATAVARHRAQP